MSSRINRRSWLQTVALSSAVMAIPGKQLLGNTNTRVNSKKSLEKFWEWEANMSGRPILKARLLANENPYGPSEMTQAAIADAIKTGNRYGHSAAEDLIGKIAAKEGVPKEYIMLGPGSSDLLEKVGITHFLEGGNILAADPTYMSIIKTASSFGAEWNSVPLKSDWEYDLEGMKNALNKDTKLVYICNPNNPTGTITNGKKLWDFCKEVSDVKPVFVDEAYLEFMDEKDQMSMVGLLQEGKDVIISRTFSKVYGMAGIRVGYIVALPSTLEKISEMVRSNMGLNITALHGALAAIEDKEFVSNSAKWNAEVKDYLYNELESMGIKYVPSHTSFVLFPIQMEGKGFLEKMFSMQVGVRSFEIFEKTYCRVSIGTLDEMKIFTSALKEVLA